MKKRIAIYPGTFDPITNGHLDIILRSLGIFDEIVVAVATNDSKQTLFTVKERQEIIKEVLVDKKDISVDSFSGLTVNYAQKKGACVILRGLRAVADFEYELQMANMNRKLNTSLETMFMMTSEKSFFVSSRNVKEVANFGGDISELVPACVAKQVYKKLKVEIF